MSSVDWYVITLCSSVRSVLNRLVSSPVRCSAKKPGESRTRCANSSLRSFAITFSATEVMSHTCTKLNTPCTAKIPTSSSASLLSSPPSPFTNAASSSSRTISGKARPIAELRSSAIAPKTSDVVYGRSRPRSGRSGAGEGSVFRASSGAAAALSAESLSANCVPRARQAPGAAGCARPPRGA